MDRDAITCNCRGECEVNNECLLSYIIYKAEVAEIREEKVLSKKVYFGQSSNKFKSRLDDYKSKFKREQGKNSTELTKYVDT